MTPDENTALGRASGSIDRPPLCAGVRAGCGHLIPGQTVHIEERTDSCGWCEREHAKIAQAVAEAEERAREEERLKTSRAWAEIADAREAKAREEERERALALAHGCHDYNGGHSEPSANEVYHHGIQTVINILEAAYGPGGDTDTQVHAVESIGAATIRDRAKQEGKGASE